MTTTLTGGCLCGAVRYQLTQPAIGSHNCHCSRCRKTSGAAFASNLFFPLDAFSYLKGEDQLGEFEPAEAERFNHVFCRRCGSTLPFRNEARGLMGIPMGSLDDDPGMSPKAHIFVDSKAPWFTITDSLPQHAEALVRKSDA